MAEKTPPVLHPDESVGDALRRVIGDTGVVSDLMGTYKIKVCHAAMFPWDEAMKALLYRDFKVYVTRHKADLFIEAQP